MSRGEATSKARPRWTALALAAVGVCGFGLFAFAQAAATDRDTSKTKEQLRIMARVIEDSLDQSDVDGWRRLDAQMSPFRGAVRSQYIPTVGAIFTVPVDFLLSPPEKPQPAGEAPAKTTDDLWERNAGDGPKGPEGAPGLPGGGIRPGLPQLPQPNFDQAKVDALRKTIVEALAKYGHRMDALPQEERVIVLVEAPGAEGPRGFGGHFRTFDIQGGPGGPGAPGMPGGPGPQTQRPGRPGGPGRPGMPPAPQDGQGLLGGPGMPPPPQGRQGGQGGPGMPPPPPQGEQGLQGAPDMPPPPPGAPGMPPAQGGFGGGMGGGMGGTVSFSMPRPDFGMFDDQADHLMISVPKSALAPTTSADALAGQITEVKY